MAEALENPVSEFLARAEPHILHGLQDFGALFVNQVTERRANERSDVRIDLRNDKKVRIEEFR